MNGAERAAEIVAQLAAKGLEETEVYLKSGRSRRFEVGPQGRVVGRSGERGWAVRAGDRRSSLMLSGTGLPRPDEPWPQPDGQPLRLPTAVPVTPWTPPADLDASLAGETEAVGLLESIEKSLVAELSGASLLRGILDEGSSETAIFNSRGVEVEYRSRTAALYVKAVGPWEASRAASLLLAEREIRSFQPVAIAKRLANRLLLAQAGTSEVRERGEFLLASAVAARLLAGLLPLLVGSGGKRLAKRLRDRQGRVASQALTVIDNGRLTGGVLEAPVDGEGTPTGELVLIEQGRYRQSLKGWRERDGYRPFTPGCMRRDSWRDHPRLAPSHLYVQPHHEVPVASLLASVTRGCYLVEPLGAGRFDFDADRFELPVCGFVLRQGQTATPLSEACLEGGIGSLLKGVQAVARDLAFHSHGGMIGSPTLLVSGVGLRRLS